MGKYYKLITNNMKFLKVLFGLVALVTADAAMDMASPYEAEFLTSEKKNFTVTAAPGASATKKGTGTVTVGYYVKKLTEKATGKSVYQLHGNCWVTGMDTTGFTASTSRDVSCAIGLYQTGSKTDVMKLSSKWSVAGMTAP